VEDTGAENQSNLTGSVFQALLRPRFNNKIQASTSSRIF